MENRPRGHAVGHGDCRVHCRVEGSDMTKSVLKGAREIGEYIGASEKTAERMCRRGDIPAYRTGKSRHWRMKIAEYEARREHNTLVYR